MHKMIECLTDWSIESRIWQSVLNQFRRCFISSESNNLYPIKKIFWPGDSSKDVVSLLKDILFDWNRADELNSNE